MGKKKEPQSLNRIINTFYIFFLALIIVFSILFSSLTTSREVANTTYANVENSLKDKHGSLDRTFNQLFEQLVYLNNNPNLLEVINDKSGSLKLAVNMNASVKDLYYRFQDVLSSIYININEGEFFFNGGTINQQLDGIDYHNFFELSDEETQYFWLDAPQNPFSTKEEPVISLGKTIGDGEAEANGVIVFNLKSEMISELLDEGYVTENGRLFLISSNNVPYPSTTKMPQEVFKAASDQEKMTVDGTVYHTLSKEFSLNGWKLRAIFPDKDLRSGQGAYLNLAGTLILFLFVVGTVMMFGVGRFISKPIQQLAKKIEGTSITDKNGDLALSDPRFQELSVLYQSFNAMIKRNEKLLDENEYNLEERNRLEIELLQSQINPHFLYNTLYSIQSLSDMNMNEDAAMMARALADFYRQGISDENVLITLKDELEHVQNYLTIMDYRYGDRFDYRLQIAADDCLEAKIPKISLQPIVENSIYHGLKQLSTFGHLELSVQPVKEEVLITIKDNGAGISPDHVQQINQELNQPAGVERKLVGIGLRSVNLRIKRYFGSAYGVWIEASETGTIVKIVIPKEGSS